MKYTMKAIETKFKNFTFRSRLEAKWAAMFELLGWNWDYEPVDFNGWIPDFAIYGDETVYVEVKPVVDFPKDVANELENSGCLNEMLIVGQIPRLKVDNKFCSCVDGFCFGWLCEVNDVRKERICYDENGNNHVDENGELIETTCIRRSFFWGAASFGKWYEANGKIGFCHNQGGYSDRIYGHYDGSCPGGWGVEDYEIEKMWAEAHRLTQWKKR